MEKYDRLDEEHEEYHVDRFERSVRRGCGAIAHYLEFECCICLYRKPQFWVMSIVLPNLIIATIGLAVFLISPVDNSDFYSDRISLLMTVVLTSVAFQFSVSANMPILPYQTALDKWRLSLNLIYMATFLECTYAQYTVTGAGERNALLSTPDTWPVDSCVLVICFVAMYLSTYIYGASSPPHSRSISPHTRSP